METASIVECDSENEVVSLENSLCLSLSFCYLNMLQTQYTVAHWAFKPAVMTNLRFTDHVEAPQRCHLTGYSLRDSCLQDFRETVPRKVRERRRGVRMYQCLGLSEIELLRWNRALLVFPNGPKGLQNVSKKKYQIPLRGSLIFFSEPSGLRMTPSLMAATRGGFKYLSHCRLFSEYRTRECLMTPLAMSYCLCGKKLNITWLKR